MVELLPHSILKSYNGEEVLDITVNSEEHRKKEPKHELTIKIAFNHEKEDKILYNLDGGATNVEIINALEDLIAYTRSLVRKHNDR